MKAPGQFKEQKKNKNNTLGQARDLRFFAPAYLHPIHSAILNLQQTYGNRYVQGLLQRKLKIGKSGDVYEQEADRVAEQVMQMPEPQTTGGMEKELHRQPVEEEEEELRMQMQPMENLGRLEDRAGANQRRKAYEAVQNKVLNITLIQKRDGEEREEEESETREEQELQEINVALYDQNPDHMREATRDAEVRSFQTWGTTWAGSHAASSHAVNSHGEIRDALHDVIGTLRPEERIGTIACFGHGSSRTGWCHMGDIGNILVAPDIIPWLSPDLRVILYMCLAGASPESALPTIEPGGEVPAREPGGIRSFAARLRDRLVGEGLNQVEVWAHSTAGPAVTNPHWRVFEAPTIPGMPLAGDAFFRMVFDYIQMDFGYLRTCYRGLDEASRVSRDRRKEFPASVEELRNNWMWKFYLNLVRGQDIAIRIPMEPEECADEIRLNWLAYRNGDSSVLIPGNTGYDFLRRNDFSDLHPPRF